MPHSLLAMGGKKELKKPCNMTIKTALVGEDEIVGMRIVELFQKQMGEHV